jgi:hypothetical protein
LRGERRVNVIVGVNLHLRRSVGRRAATERKFASSTYELLLLLLRAAP